MEFRHSHNPCPPCDASDKTTCPSPEPRLLSHTVPPPPLPALDSPAWYAPTTPSGLANSPVDSPPLLPLLPDAKYTADFAVSARSVPVPMLISSRRWLIGVVATLCTLGWLWHVAVVDRVAPDVWSRADYAEAESVLEGWRAAVCKNAGLCGNFYSKSASTNFKNVHQGGVVENLGDPSTPDFVVEYAPLVYLHSEEKFLPGDIGEHLMHTTPYLNYTPITSSGNHPLLTNLHRLNKYGDHVYLTSDDDPENPPAWLRGDKNKPLSSKDGDNSDLGLSSAPGIIIWAEKGNENGAQVIDAFYFYFYSFNLGNTVAGWRFGNHIGDWEHTAIRFVGGQPISVFYSEHSGGAAYEYAAVEKIGKRPISYAARGSHANYATPGPHYYVIPFHLLADYTDKGTLWDVTKNAYVYNFDVASQDLIPSAQTPNAPVEWFHFEGRWGDRVYKLNDPRQYRVAGQYHYVNGPTGPKDKNLQRTEICQNENICVVQPSLTYRLEGVDGPIWDSDEDEPLAQPGHKPEPIDVVWSDNGEAEPENDGDSDLFPFGSGEVDLRNPDEDL